MIPNPEFRRHLWLELTSHRLVAMPLVLGLVFALVYVSFQAGGGNAPGATAVLALWGFAILVLLWGPRLAGDAVANEIRGRTWDAQRMSALPPWSMAWGKLLGGPIYPWYGAALCAAVYLAGAAREPRERVENLLLLTFLGVLLHALTLLGTLQAVRKSRTAPGRNLGLLPLVAFLFAIPILQLMMTDAARENSLAWYRWSPSLFELALVSTGVYAAWAVVGFYRLTRAELQLRNAPWVWLAFLAFVMVHLAGFVPRGVVERLGDAPLAPARLFVAYLAGLAAVYVTAFAERKDAAVFRRLHRFHRLGQRERLLDELPLWLASLALAAAVGVALLAQPGLGAAAKQLVAGLFLLALRDLGLLLGLNFARDARRADLAGLVYLFVLWWVAPGLAEQLGGEGARSFFRPRDDVGPLAALLPLALEAAAVWLWARLRWKRVAAGWPAEPPPPGGAEPARSGA